MQLTHYNTNFNKKSFPITLVCDHIVNAANIGSLFRLADAFGIKNIIFCGENFELGKRYRRTSRSTEHHVNYSIESDISKAINALKDTNHYIIALEITKTSQAITNVKFNNSQPLALIIGNENYGVSEDVLNHANKIIHIPMHGNNSSMNVVQATSIALYEMTKQFNS